MGKCCGCKARKVMWITVEGKRKFCRDCKTATCTPWKWHVSPKEEQVANNISIDPERLGNLHAVVAGINIDLKEVVDL
jgi:hypothetical protein